MTTLTPNDVGRFIKNEFTAKVEADFCKPPFRIFRERDLQSCCYFHLRRFLRQDQEWSVLNEPYLRNIKGRGKGGHPDLVLFRRDRPVILIELKFRRRLSGVLPRDQLVLRRAVTNARWAKKAYFVELVIEPSRETRRKLKPYRNCQITIVMPPDRLEDYLTAYSEKRKPQPRKR